MNSEDKGWLLTMALASLIKQNGGIVNFGKNDLVFDVDASGFCFRKDDQGGLSVWLSKDAKTN